MNNQPTILGVDTTTQKLIVFLAYLQRKRIVLVDKIVKDAPDHGSEDVLKLVDRLLKKHRIGPERLSKIAVNPGPKGPEGEEARFTATRVGVSVANTFAFVLKKKISPFVWQKGDIKIKKAQEIVFPKYQKRPNITKSNSPLRGIQKELEL